MQRTYHRTVFNRRSLAIAVGMLLRHHKPKQPTLAAKQNVAKL